VREKGSKRRWQRTRKGERAIYEEVRQKNEINLKEGMDKQATNRI
jgi:hypothetical protein